MDFAFDGAPDTAAIICCHIVNEAMSVLHV